MSPCKVAAAVHHNHMEYLLLQSATRFIVEQNQEATGQSSPWRLIEPFGYAAPGQNQANACDHTAPIFLPLQPLRTALAAMLCSAPSRTLCPRSHLVGPLGCQHLVVVIGVLQLRGKWAIVSYRRLELAAVQMVTWSAWVSHETKRCDSQGKFSVA